MIDLILVSHGSLAAGLREAAEMILVEQEQMEVFGVFPGDTADAFSGCNLPMLIEVLSLRTEAGMEELLKTACASGRSGIVSAEDMTAERKG